MICPNCKRKYTPALLLPKDSARTKIKMRQWQGGRKIQNVWPDATPIHREQLQTGICSDACWDEYLSVADKGRP